MQYLLALLFLSICSAASPEQVTLPGLEKPVEILRDRWGVPHIYAQSTGDLFFAQGWITARDRLFQIDLWRRTGTGKLAEVLGPEAVGRDRIARLVRFRGDWKAEIAPGYWASAGPVVFFGQNTSPLPVRVRGPFTMTGIPNGSVNRMPP